jgi:hypothetical protein
VNQKSHLVVEVSHVVTCVSGHHVLEKLRTHSELVLLSHRVAESSISKVGDDYNVDEGNELELLAHPLFLGLGCSLEEILFFEFKCRVHLAVFYLKL